MRKVPITEMGMATATTRVPVALRRKRMSTAVASKPPRKILLTTKSIAEWMYTVSS